MKRNGLCIEGGFRHPQAPLADWLLVAFVGLLLGVGALGWAATVGGVIPA
jgi:hypothetical protein